MWESCDKQTLVVSLLGYISLVVLDTDILVMTLIVSLLGYITLVVLDMGTLSASHVGIM